MIEGIREIENGLQDLGVLKVFVEYNGYGDSGDIESPCYETEDGKAVEVPSELESKIIDLLYHYLEKHHGGWEINEGSQGQMTIDFPERTIDIEHNENYLEVNTTNHSEQF